MSDYIKELEKQNEHLQQKLADAELIKDWHNHRIHKKLYFTYDISFAEHDRHVEWRGQPRLRVREIIRGLRNRSWKEAITLFTHDESVNKIQIHIQGWRNFFNVDRDYIIGKTITIECYGTEFKP